MGNIKINDINRVMLNSSECSELVYNDITLWPVEKSGYDYEEYRVIPEGDDMNIEYPQLVTCDIESIDYD